MEMLETLVHVTREGLYLVLLVAAPAVLTAVGVGLIMGILQAVTQVQEPSLGFVAKLVAVLVVLGFSLPWMGYQVRAFTAAVLGLLPRVGGG